MQLAYLTGDRPAAERHAQAGFALASSAVEAAELHSIQIVDCSMRGAYPEAITRGREALARLGVELPAPARGWHEDRRRLGGPRPEDLLELPRMRDPRQLACMQLMANLLDPAYVCDPGLLVVLVERMVELSLAHGNCVYSAFAYTVYGMIVASRDGDYRTGHAFGTLGVNLARAFGDPVQECRALHIFGAFVNHWRAPVASSLPRLRLAVTRALEGGDLHYGVYADYTAITAELHRGAELGQVAGDLENAFALTRKIRVGASLGYLQACRQTIRALQGRTAGPRRVRRRRLRPAGVPGAPTPATRSPSGCTRCCGCRSPTCWAICPRPRSGPTGPSRCARWSGRSCRWWITPSTGRWCAPAPPSCLAAARPRRTAGPARASCWPGICGSWRPGRPELPGELPPQAAAAGGGAGAPEGGRRGRRAVRPGHRRRPARGVPAGRGAGQRAGRPLPPGLGRRRIGDFYLRAAMEGFARWGAPAKVAALEEEFPHLAELPWRTPLPTIGADGKALDLLSLLKAAGTISSEVVLERLIERLLAICFEVGGAARGALLLEQEGGLTVRALGSLGGALSLEGTPMGCHATCPGG